MSFSSMKMEVADQVTSAGAAAATNEGNKVLSSVGAGAMSAVSLLFAWMAAGTLRRYGAITDEEEAFSGVLWGLSPLICAYLFCWTVTLSPAPRAKVAGGAVFARATCLLLLAVAADKLIGPVAGAAAIVLATLYSACACGRALAKRRQSAGTERWSAAAVASTPTYQSRAEERHERRCVVEAVSCIVLTVVLVPAFVFLAEWTSPAAEWEVPDPDDSTVVVFFLAGPFVLAARLMPPCMAGSPVLYNVGDVHFIAALIGVSGWLVVVVSASNQFGMIAGALVFWMGELGMLGILGYYLAVEAHWKQLMTIERGKPRRAKDASGLLDGRDGGDACSAHIDAAAGICVDCVLPKRCKCACGSQIIS